MRRISDSGFGYALGKLIRSSHALISHDHRTNLESRSSVESNLRVENLELEVDTEQQQRSRQRQKWRGGQMTFAATRSARTSATSPTTATLHM